MPAAIRPTITKIPVRAAEESFTGDGMGAATGSPAERLPALAAELQVPGVLRLAARARHGLWGAAVPAELLGRGLLGPALRAHLHLLRGLHLAHLARHGIPHADPGAEAEARA